MIPAQKKGKYSIRHIRGCRERLCEGNDDIWANTHSNRKELENVTKKLSGRVLLSGLGLGMLAEMVAAKTDITSVVIVEIGQEVIDMVWPYLDVNGKCSVVCADIWGYEVGDFDSAYIDIADCVCNKLPRAKMREKLKHIPKVILYGE